MYVVRIGERRSPSQDLDHAVWHMKIVLETGRRHRLIKAADFKDQLRLIENLKDHLLPWQWSTDQGVILEIAHAPWLTGANDR